MNKYIEKNIDYEKESLGGLQEILSEKYDSLPKDKRTKEYQLLKEEYNKIAAFYNVKAKDKIYTIIK